VSMLGIVTLALTALADPIPPATEARILR
jgi:hypothetical protein